MSAGAGSQTVDDARALARRVLGEIPAWVVGGALRDRLLGRATDDLDLAVEGDPAQRARELARACGGTAFSLSEQHAAWRVVVPERRWHVDLTPLEGDITTDLARRDFTVNAIAEPLQGGERLDPFGGLADLRARRLRMVSAEAFADDPLRVMRAARLACELGLEVDPATARAAAAQASRLPEVASERVFAELRNLVCAPEPLRGLVLMEELGATAEVLPELIALRGVEQSPYHHLDVHDHTLDVLGQVVELQRDAEPALGEQAAPVAAVLAEPLADELTRAEALRFGALLHDVAKPRTRDRVAGRITFMGHDEAGAAMAHSALVRLRASGRLADHVAQLTRHHLRLGFLVRERPLSRRAVHRYLKACGPVAVDVTVLSVADRLATRGRRADEAIAAHLELARELLDDALRWQAGERPVPLVRGDELAVQLGIAPGPELGRLLDELEEAQFAGEITTSGQALEYARRRFPAPPA